MKVGSCTNGFELMRRRLIVGVAAMSVIFALAAIYVGFKASQNLSRQVLEQRASEKARIWTNYFSASVDDLEGLLRGLTEPTNRQLRQLEEAKQVSNVFLFKLFAPDGRLLLLSDQLEGAQTSPVLGERNAVAIDVMQTGQSFVAIENGRDRADRPDWYAIVYYPIVENDQKLGVIKVDIDVSTSFAETKSAFWSYGFIVAALIFGVLLLPALLLTYLIRRLRAATEAAQISEAAKGRFLAKMSHELRTPMNGVLGMADLLRHTDLNEKQRGFLDIISSSSQALLVVLNDVLDISSIEEGAMQIRPEPTDVGALIHDVTTLLMPMAGAKQLQLSVEIEPRCQRLFIVDPDRLRQCLMNLIGNAIKFTEKGGIEVRLHSELDHLDISVTDTGIGIPLEAQARVFSAFEQVEDNYTRRFNGTGLGLAITSQLIKLMSGSIALSSTPGEGSKFTISLPLTDTDAEAAPQRPVAMAAE